MSVEAEFLEAFEEHSARGIRAALAAGASATAAIKGKRPIDEFLQGYWRSNEFSACLQVLFDAGASVGDALLEAVLLDDDMALKRVLRAAPGDASRRLRVPCAFTSCGGVTALHVCAEYNRVRCARVLIEAGADVNAAADIDAAGVGGQTPVFHTVNSIFNYCRPMLELLVNAGANLKVRVNALLWGPGADWETVVVDVTPLSYAQCGLFRQFHRTEADVYSNVAYLYEKRHSVVFPSRNVPNRYLAPKS